MANARTTQDTGRSSATTRDTASSTGTGGRGKSAARGDQAQSNLAQKSGAADTSRRQQASSQGQGQSQAQSSDQSRTAGQSGAQRGDTERQVPVGRETQRQGGAMTIRDQAQGLGATAAGSAAQQRVNSPFSFMRRFGEEMDRLFEDFGFAPLGLDPMDLIIATPRSGLAPGRSLGSGTSGQRGLTTGRSALTRQSPAGSLSSTRATWLPQVEVLQRGGNLVVRADLPGLRSDDVRVEVDNGALTISGERSYLAEDDDEGVFHSERVYGSFVRTIPLPQGVNPEDVQARFADGVLEVTVPLPKESRSRRVEVR